MHPTGDAGFVGPRLVATFDLDMAYIPWTATARGKTEQWRCDVTFPQSYQELPRHVLLERFILAEHTLLWGVFRYTMQNGPDTSKTQPT